MLILHDFIGAESCKLHFCELLFFFLLTLCVELLFVSKLLMDLQIDYAGILFIIFQLLVDWTRGKNLIFSSAAPSVNGLRGPYDVANLSSLLGLSMERAKAAISKNCRYENF
jgi:hypothetical protein